MALAPLSENEPASRLCSAVDGRKNSRYLVTVEGGKEMCLCLSVSTWSCSRLECPAMKNSPFLPPFFFHPFFSFQAEHEEGSSDRNTRSPAGLVRIHYRLQLQHGLECEESFWAGVLAQGSKTSHRSIFPSLWGESGRLGSERCASLSPPGGGGGRVQGVAADEEEIRVGAIMAHKFVDSCF